MTPRPNSNERDRRTAGPGMLLAPWEATAGGVRLNSAGKSRNAAVDALKICKWGFKLAGTKSEEFLCSSPSFAGQV